MYYRSINIVLIIILNFLQNQIFANSQENLLQTQTQPLYFITNIPNTSSSSINLHLQNESIDTKWYHTSNNIIFESQIIPQPQFIAFAHSPSIVKLINGELVAVWFAGSREGGSDVKIWQSSLINNQWTMATPIISSFSLMHDTYRYIGKLGNAVIMQNSDGLIHLFVLSVGFTGWGASSINHMFAYDSVRNWSAPTRVITSPFFNISTLVRSSAVLLNDGSFYLPSYQEFIFKYPELLHFNKDGQLINKIRIKTFSGLIQPSMVVLNKTTALMYFRNNGHKNRTLYFSITTNTGKTWSTIKPTNLNNYDSSIALAKLHNTLIMVYSSEGRKQLILAASTNGVNWHKVKILENNTTSTVEFSYPNIIVKNDQVYLVYTWQIYPHQRYIKYLHFNQSWFTHNV